MRRNWRKGDLSQAVSVVRISKQAGKNGKIWDYDRGSVIRSLLAI